MTEIFTAQTLKKRLDEIWAKRGFPLEPDARMGISISELVDHSRQRNDALDLPFVDLWIAILDEHLSWFISLATVVYTERDRSIRTTNFERSIVTLLAKAIADMTAIRHLVLAGFDTSARTILRSLSEYLEVLVAIIHQPAFADEFVKSETPEDSQEFWEKHLRGGKIRKRVTAAWDDFFTSEDRDGAAQWFANWGRGSNQMLSGLAHPSFGGGIFTALPFKAKVNPDENWLGLWGDKAESSVDTVFILLQFLFPVLLLGREFPFDMGPPYLGSQHTYDEGNELHRHVRVGRDILSSLILAISHEDTKSAFFPEIDMSLWPAEPPKADDGQNSVT